MRRLLFAASMLFAVLFVFSASAFAFHPLITDDAGTQGKGKYQLEVNGQYGHDKSDGSIRNTTQTAITLTYGLTDPVDISIGIPYALIRTKDSEGSVTHDGLEDVGIAVKWKFYEKEGLSFALKPGLTFSTGDQDKELGTGKPTYSLFLIATKEVKPWAFHLNVGYIGNENKIDQRVSLWHASIAAEVEVVKSLKVVANTGIQRNVDRSSHTDPAFLLGGLVYSVSENIDIDVGYKYGLTKTEVDHTVLAGITIKF
jgi:opacity protein-like surface antigen